MPTLKKSLLKSSALKSGSLLKKFRKDKDGIAAIEFALIAPILIFMYLGLLEISMGIMADRDVSHAANVAGDLATQVEELDKAELDNILTAAVTVMAPRRGSVGNIRMHLESWDIDSSNNASRSLGKATMGAAITKGAPDIEKLRTLNLLTENSGVVVATINYDYKPVGTTYLKETITLYETFVLKPRRSESIQMKDASGNQKNFTCSVDETWEVKCS